jgi:hypothetical protein
VNVAAMTMQMDHELVSIGQSVCLKVAMRRLTLLLTH